MQEYILSAQLSRKSAQDALLAVLHKWTFEYSMWIGLCSKIDCQCWKSIVYVT